MACLRHSRIVLELSGTQPASLCAGGWVNRFRQRLTAQQFAVNVELVTPRADRPLAEALEPFHEFATAMGRDERIAAVAVTDRVKSDGDHDPVATAAWVAQRCGLQPLVHWAGKDRTPDDLERSLEALAILGLENVLAITGDRVERDRGDRQVEYLDAVNVVAQAKHDQAGLHVGAVVSSFKYREEELFNQYFKMAKKVRAGADFIIAQIGLDFAKHRELLDVARLRLPGVPILAALLSPSPRTASWIRTGGAPGVSLTDDLLRLIGEESEAPDGGRAARRRRLALQMVGLELAGYAGVQLTGLHTVSGARALLDTADELRATLPNLSSWQEAWDASLRLKDGGLAATAPVGGYYLADARAPLSAPPAQGEPAAKAGFGSQAKFHFLDAIDRAIFQDRGPAAGVMRLLSVGHIPVLDRGLLRLEQATKEPLVGCRTCGFCRLPYTQYVCPETCPKGLANGPCGGTNDNRCEFGDRECIHNQRYRLSKARGSTAELETLLIPPVPGTRGTCSWTNHFRGEDPHVIPLPERLPAVAS